MLSGILNIDKPSGVTSFSVVSRVRRLTGIRRVGHAGTLDPMASGVLPTCVGQATRVVEYLVEQPKLYRGTFLLGVTTDTYDRDGTVIETVDPSAVTQPAVSSALHRFVGAIDQTPPMYSALKRGGRPLYEYARAGKTVELAPRRVNVYRIELVRFELPEVEVEIECGQGAYVRSIAHDLGLALGCGAHLSALTRLRSGPFSIDHATPLQRFESAGQDGWSDLLLATDRVLEGWPAAILSEVRARETRHGRALRLQSFTSTPESEESGARCRAYSGAGELLALLRHEGGGLWRPVKVFDSL